MKFLHFKHIGAYKGLGPLASRPADLSPSHTGGRDAIRRDKTVPSGQCAGLQDGLSLVFRTVLSMLNV